MVDKQQVICRTANQNTAAKHKPSMRSQNTAAKHKASTRATSIEFLDYCYPYYWPSYVLYEYKTSGTPLDPLE
jgi:hypothetical protein